MNNVFLVVRQRCQAGIGMVTAIFLLVVMSAIGVAMFTLFNVQQATSSLDELGARAYQAARAGVEWGVYQQLRNNSCVASTTFALPATSALSGFSVTVKCTQYGSDPVTRWVLNANACNMPGPAGCPNPGNHPDYVERELEVEL